MRVKKQPVIYRSEDSTLITIETQQNDFYEAIDFAKKFEKADGKKEFDLSAKQRRKHRSLDANAYLWVLIGKLAEVLKLPTEEVYRLQIQGAGAYEILPIKNEAVERWKDIWTSKGLGWICENMGASKLKEYTNLRCFYGTSVYDTEQMSRILDSVINECKLQGIETLTPDELERIKQTWQNAE